MINPLERWRQRQARRKYMPRTRRGRAGTTTKVAIVALIVILGTAAVLEMRSSDGPEGALVEHARADALDPLEMAEAAARSHRLVFLADIKAAVAPKRFAAQAVERIASTSGLDFVVLEVDSNEQQYIDLYLATAPQDASILLGRPRAIRDGDPSSRAYLDLYSAIWQANQELGADRRIRIIAADLPGWPLAQAASPNQRAEMYGRRDAHMLEVVRERALARNANARVFFFLDGLQTLKSGGGRIQAGGTRPVDVTWLAARLAGLYSQDVFSILVDATPAGAVSAPVASYRGTAAGTALRRGGISSGAAFRVDNGLFDALARPSINVVGTTGLEFNFEPRDDSMSRLADAYIFFGN